MPEFWRLPLDAAEHTVPQGKIIIIADRCKGCDFCIEFCPNEVLTPSEQFNRKGYHPPEVIKAEDCVNCGLCQVICPEFAIYAELDHEKHLTEADVQKHSVRLSRKDTRHV
jgi:2-oxoglutarate ferredoxin oxidoreductase subunit delta